MSEQTDAERVIAAIAVAGDQVGPDKTLVGLFDKPITELHSWTASVHRWHRRHVTAYQCPDGTFVAVAENLGATEEQEAEPCAEAYVVEPYTVTITMYRKPDPTAEQAPVAEIPDPNYQSLGELIAALEAAPQDHVVPIGFHNPHSYRGDYMDLAFEAKVNATVAEMLAAARSALGTTYEGWKGGDFVMDESTPVWLVTERGDCGESLGRVLTHLMLNTEERSR